MKLINFKHCFIKINFLFKMGIGDWGLGIGDWGLVPIPNPQSPIPNPQSPIPNYKDKTFLNFIIYLIMKKILIIFLKL